MPDLLEGRLGTLPLAPIGDVEPEALPSTYQEIKNEGRTEGRVEGRFEH